MNRLISIVAPAYNEQENIEAFYTSLCNTMSKINERYTWDIIFVNDGSEDETLLELEKIASSQQNVAVIDLARNFGKEIAMTAGIDFAEGDAVIIIDTDLQDPPELIHKFIEKWESGADVVYATRRIRHGESGVKKATASLFYKFMSLISDIEIPENTGDFRLMSRRAVEALRELRERHRFMKGIFSWIGYNQVSVEYDRQPRFAGKTKFNYWKLWNFAVEGITSFSSIPLRIATYIGSIIALLSFIYGLFIIIKTIFFGTAVPGYPSLMVVILFLGGVNLIFLGIIGEYLARMFLETKQRPLYLIKNIYTPEK